MIRFASGGLIALIALTVAGAFVACNELVLWPLGGSAAEARVAGSLGAVLVLAADNAALVLLGGEVLRRFDVARDRG
jgi:hypothetical protein